MLPTRSWFRPALLLLLPALFAGILWFPLRTPTPRLVDLGAAEDSHFIYDFYAPEFGTGAQFRWSGPNARLMLHGAGSGSVRLSLRLNGERPRDDADPLIRLERDDRVFATLSVQPDWRAYHILLPPGAATDRVGTAQPIFLVADTERPGIGDGRDLGVPVDRFSYQPLLPAAGSWLRAIMLAWMCGLAGWLIFGLPALLGWRGPPQFRLFPAIAGSTLLAAGLLIAAARDPYSLAWAIPSMPWSLGLATIVLWHLSADPARPAAATTAPPANLAAVWIGLGLLLTAQVLFLLQTATWLAIGLALPGLALLFRGDHGRALIPDSRWVPGKRLTTGLLLLIFGAALGLRFFQLADLPYGLWRDEARHGMVAAAIADVPGYRPVYIAENRVNMPALGFYPFAVALGLWGPQIWTMRVVTALAGALTVFPIFALTLALSRRRDLALLAAALLAASSWHLTISRFSFPTIFDPLLGLSGLWLLLLALRPPASANAEQPARRLLFAALAGVCIGLAVQTYHTGRVVPVVAGGLAWLLLLQDRRRWRVWLAATLAAVLSFGLVIWPLVSYALDRPQAFNDRVNDVFLLSEEALKARAPLAALDDTVGRHLLMFNLRGDENGRHHAPGAPMLDFVTGLGFLVGAGLLLRRWQDWRSLFLAGGLVVSLLPSALAVDAPHAMRSIGAAAFACIIATLGWAMIVQRASASLPVHRAPQPLPAVFASVILLALALNAYTYFVSMARDPAAWRSFYPVQTKMAAYLSDLAEQEPQNLPPIYVVENLNTDPVFRYLAPQLPVHMFDGEYVSRPPMPGDWFVLGGYTYRDERAMLAQYLGANAEPIRRGPPFPDGSAPAFVIYEVP